MPKKGKGRSGMSAKRGKDLYCIELSTTSIDMLHRALVIFSNCVIINQYMICYI